MKIFFTSWGTLLPFVKFDFDKTLDSIKSVFGESYFIYQDGGVAKEPNDVGKKFNEIKKDIFERTKSDFIVIGAIDIYILKDKMIKCINQLCIPENLNKSFNLNGLAMRLYHVNYPCVMLYIIGKDSDVYFIGDGVLKGDNINDVDGYVALDVGYLTIESYHTHKKFNLALWNSDTDHKFDLYDTDLTSYVKHNLQLSKENMHTMSKDLPQEAIDYIKSINKEEELKFVHSL